MNIKQFLESAGLDMELSWDRLGTKANPNEYVYTKFDDHQGKSLEVIYYGKNEPEGFENRLLHTAIFHGGIKKAEI